MYYHACYLLVQFYQSFDSGLICCITAFLLYMLNVAFAFGLLSALYGDFMQVRILQLIFPD